MPNVPIDPPVWTLIVVHASDLREHGYEPAVTAYATYDAALRGLRDAFDEELELADEVSDDGLIDWLWGYYCVHASIVQLNEVIADA